jgi:phosphoribosylglycinamide formyltransferase-1
VSGDDFRIGVLGSGNGTNCEAILEACDSGRIPGRVVIVLSDVADAKILERARRRVVKAVMLTSFAGRIINVHPSLLPAFPGLRAWEQALEHGARITGCTVHFVDEGVDAGPIILQQPVPIFDNDTPESLHQRIQKTEHALLPEAIRLFATGKLQINGRRVKILN